VSCVCVSTHVSCVSTSLYIKRACLSRVVCSSFLSHATSCLYYESTACQPPSSSLFPVLRSLVQRSLASVLSPASARLSAHSFPAHLSKWSPALVPGALVQVVARSRPQRHLSKWSPVLVLSGTCLSGRLSSLPAHLSKWSPILVLSSTCPSGHPSPSLFSALTCTAIHHRRSLVRRRVIGTHSFGHLLHEYFEPLPVHRYSVLTECRRGSTPARTARDGSCSRRICGQRYEGTRVGGGIGSRFEICSRMSGALEQF
jgi:hypothetical protein